MRQLPAPTRTHTHIHVRTYSSQTYLFFISHFNTLLGSHQATTMIVCFIKYLFCFVGFLQNPGPMHVVFFSKVRICTYVQHFFRYTPPRHCLKNTLTKDRWRCYCFRAGSGEQWASGAIQRDTEAAVLQMVGFFSPFPFIS